MPALFGAEMSHERGVIGLPRCWGDRMSYGEDGAGSP